MAEPVIALAMAGRPTVPFLVMRNWVETLRAVHWPGPTFMVPDHYLIGHWIGVCPIRNIVTFRALQERSWSHLLWIDADHMIHPGIVERAYELAGDPRIENVGGLYFARTYPFEVQAFGYRTDTGHINYITPVVMEPALRGGSIPRSALPNNGVDAFYQPAAGLPLMRVVGLGTGCMMTRRDVLERMVELHGESDIWRVDRVPWLELRRLLEMGENPSGVLTEDVNFCMDIADMLGVPTWLDLDPRFESGHLGEEARGRQHYLAAHELPPGVSADDPRLKLPPGYEVVKAR